MRGACVEVGTLSPRSFACIVLLCGASIVMLNFNTTKIVQAFTIVFIPNDRTVRDITWKSSLQTIQTTTFPSDIHHDWKDNDTDDRAIYILSAIGFNATAKKKVVKSNIKLNGWVTKKNRNHVFECCVLLNSGVTINKKHWSKLAKGPAVNLIAHQYECQVNAFVNNVRGIHLHFADSGCPQNKDRYIKPFIPKKVTTEESFAICLKIVFGNVDNVKLKDWLEYNKGIGVDKVFMYTYNISQATRDVLRHYIKQGFVEKRPFAYPWNNTRHIGEKTIQVFEDEQVVVSDCLQRLSRYKYLAVIDLDEYLVPRKHEDIKSLMKYLMKTYPEAGGFQLYSYIFDKGIQPNPNTANLPDFMRYFKRTIGLTGKKSRNKNIVLPSRIKVGGYHTHRFETLPEYEKIIPNTTDVTLNHYRHCYSNLSKRCLQLTTDTFIRKFYKLYRQNAKQGDKPR